MVCFGSFGVGVSENPQRTSLCFALKCLENVLKNSSGPFVSTDHGTNRTWRELTREQNGVFSANLYPSSVTLTRVFALCGSEQKSTQENVFSQTVKEPQFSGDENRGLLVYYSGAQE